MNTSPKGIDLIKRYEGLRLEAYLCPAGVWTIGWGTTRIGGKPVSKGMKITVAQAEKLLIDDLQPFENYVNDLIDVPLKQNQFDALVSLVYNIGPTNLGRSTLRRYLNNKQFAAAQLEFLRWNRAAGQVLRGLTRRRLDEAVMFGPASREELIRVAKPDV